MKIGTGMYSTSFRVPDDNKAPWGELGRSPSWQVSNRDAELTLESAPAPRSLIERRTVPTQHRGKVRAAVLAEIATPSVSAKIALVVPLKCAIPCCGCCGMVLGEEDKDDLLPRPPRAGARSLIAIELR